jgi:tetrahydromethanopterin S-methyltransferase subunit G
VAVEQRVSRLEGAYEQVDRRLDGIERTLEALRSETNSRFNTLYIIMAALWVSVVGLLIGLYFK